MILIHITIAVLLIIYTIQDIRYKRIHILYGAAAAVLIIIMIFFQENPNIMLRLGGVLTGLVMYGFSIITKEQIGRGDAIVLMITGLGLGFWDNLNFFFFGLICATVYSIIRIIKYGFKRRETIPFMPFLFSGYLIMMVLQYS